MLFCGMEKYENCCEILFLYPMGYKNDSQLELGIKNIVIYFRESTETEEKLYVLLSFNSPKGAKKVEK